jgi:hypothetical protein
MSLKSRHPRGGVVGSNNMMLAAVLAMLSYVPFDWVAKGSLLFAVFLFVVDPIPPASRLLALISVIVVGLLSKIHRRWLDEENKQDGAGASNTIVPNQDSRRRTAATNRRVHKED